MTIPAKLSEIAGNREMFRPLQVLLSPRPFLRGKAGLKMNEFQLSRFQSSLAFSKHGRSLSLAWELRQGCYIPEAASAERCQK